MIGRGVQIDQSVGPSRMTGGESGELVARDRVSDEIHLSETQRVKHSQQVGHSGRNIVPFRWLARSAKAAASDRDYPESVDELRGEVVEYMPGVPEAREEDQGFAGATPLEDFKGDAGRDDPPGGVGRRVAPGFRPAGPEWLGVASLGAAGDGCQNREHFEVSHPW